MQHISLAFGTPGPIELTFILIVALLLFGRRLPDVARSVGKSIVEFKKGIKDVKDDIDVQTKLEAHPAPKMENKSNDTGESKGSATPQ